MNIPNLITILRILLVPVTIWLIISGAYGWAFAAFILAGVSDGIDGFIAKQYNMRTELGSYLDPLADKLLLVSIYLSLGFLQLAPAWLVILVASRDVLIVGAVLLSWVLDKPVKMRPLMVSKVNTTMQIVLAGSVLLLLGLDMKADQLLLAGGLLVAALTLASGALYMKEWLRHMANGSKT
jgi:cardiolipin synthase (CMP-forming)